MQETVKSVGNYRIGKTIGTGTFGQVKLGTHIGTNEQVAIKILEKEKMKEKQDLERVSREINILKRLRHPNIVQLYEIVETSNSLYLIMEYSPGGELFEYITKNGRVKESEAAQFLHQLISVIEYIHEHRVMHRDLKPENILLDQNKCLKIVDFGLSNTYDENQMLKTACGSPSYASPEIISGKGYHGKPADIWSCGVILFAMICGRLPFEDPHTPTLYKKISNARYDVPIYLTPFAVNLLSGILNPDPVKRFKVDQILNHYFITSYIPNPQLIPGQGIEIETRILDMLPNHKYDIEFAKECILNNKHNQITTTYYLLHKKFQLEPIIEDIIVTQEYPEEQVQHQVISQRQISIDSSEAIPISIVPQPTPQTQRKKQISPSVEKRPENLFPTQQQILEKAQRFKVNAIVSTTPQRVKPLSARTNLPYRQIINTSQRNTSPSPFQIKQYSGAYNMRQLFFTDPALMATKIIEFLKSNYQIQVFRKYDIKVTSPILMDLVINQICEGVYILRCPHGYDSRLFQQLINIL